MRRFGPACIHFVVLLFLVTSPALAIEPEECPTWFPDFRCERSGRYDGFVMPMQMPYLFEDPFITTGLNLVGIWNQFPNNSAMEGGEAWVLALQARVAITDRLAFIATKDGYAWHRPDNPILKNENGFYDISAGLKYALIDRREDNLIVSPTLRFDVPVGQNRMFQGWGDGSITPGLSAAWGLQNFHVIGDLGGRIPFDGQKQTTSFFWNLHLDYAVLPFLVPFVEAGGVHYTNSGKGTFKVDTAVGKIPLAVVQSPAGLGTGPFDGVDVANIGSPGIAGDSVVLFTVGARFPFLDHYSVGASYDFPVSGQEDIVNQRATISITAEF